MLSGSEEIWYTPVEAYGVSTFAETIVSGGTGGGTTMTEGVRFLWQYHPDKPDRAPSGFTGLGWFENTDNSPIWYSTQSGGITLQGILDEFASGSRVNLNDVFQKWQSYVYAKKEERVDVVQQFQAALMENIYCWSNI